METHHGVPLHLWNRAKEEIRGILTALAQASDLISYSELAKRVKTVSLTPDSHALHEMLGDISVEEDTGGKGMLSAVVIYKTGPKRPGHGFFTLADRLGRDVSDEDACWVNELKVVYAAHARRRR